jgi:hypothetical protein
LKSLRRGQRLWNIVQDEFQLGGRVDDSASEVNSARTRTDDGTAESSDAASYKSALNFIVREDAVTLKSLGVDLSESVALHYGMIIIVMNSSEEVVAINEYNEIICKNLKDLKPQDYYLFKIVDLDDFTYPGPVEYGRPIWLQVYKDCKPSGDKSVDQLLGAKVNHSPDMGTHNFEDTKQSPVGTKIPSLSPPQKAGKLTPGTATPAIAEDDDKASRSDSVSGADVNANEASRGKSNSVEGAASKSAAVGTSSTGRSAVVQPEICGGLSVVNMLDGFSTDPKEEVITRQRMKHSFYLCQWIVRFAERNSSMKKRLLGDTTRSDDLVYIEQDLYCMASSVGSQYELWPKRPYERHSEYFRVKADMMNQNKSDKAFDPFLDLVSYKPGEGSEVHKASATIKNVTLDKKDLRQLLRPRTALLPEDIHYGCVRRVAIKEPPAVTVVDRRCVWRLVPANNFGDTNLLSAKEKIAHKLLRTAETRLEQSQRAREGSKVYQTTTPKGKPLCGGENFSKMLRAIICQKRFDEETESLNNRRKQERLLLTHFEGLYEYSVGESEKLRFPKVLGPPSPSRSKFSLHPDQSLFMDSHTEALNDSSALLEDIYDDARNSQLKENSVHTLQGKSIEDYLNEDSSFGGNMLKLHRSLSEANSKIVVMAQPGRPNPFKPTVIQTNDFMGMSTASGVSFPKLTKQHTSIGRTGGSRQSMYSRGASSLSLTGSSSTSTLATNTRDTPVTGGSLILNQQEMTSFNKKLDKLGEVDSVVEAVRTEYQSTFGDFDSVNLSELLYRYV